MGLQRSLRCRCFGGVFAQGAEHAHAATGMLFSTLLLAHRNATAADSYTVARAPLMAIDSACKHHPAATFHVYHLPWALPPSMLDFAAEPRFTCTVLRKVLNPLTFFEGTPFGAGAWAANTTRWLREVKQGYMPEFLRCLFRLAVLYKHGGWYIDPGTIVLTYLGSLTSVVALSEAVSTSAHAQKLPVAHFRVALGGFPPHHEFLYKAMARLVEAHDPQKTAWHALLHLGQSRAGTCDPKGRHCVDMPTQHEVVAHRANLTAADAAAVHAVLASWPRVDCRDSTANLSACITALAPTDFFPLAHKQCAYQLRRALPRLKAQPQKAVASALALTVWHETCSRFLTVPRNSLYDVTYRANCLVCVDMPCTGEVYDDSCRNSSTSRGAREYFAIEDKPLQFHMLMSKGAVRLAGSCNTAGHLCANLGQYCECEGASATHRAGPNSPRHTL